MKKTTRSGLALRSSAIALCFAMLVSSCDQDNQENVSPQKDEAGLEKYYSFLEEASGVARTGISYDKATDRFTVDNDMVVDRATLDTYLSNGTLESANGRRSSVCTMYC